MQSFLEIMNIKKFKWIEGRQENMGKPYYKMCLVNFKRFDIWLIKYPQNTGLVTHTDPVPDGFEHHRLNFILQGEAAFVCPKAYINTKYLTYFRPDVMPHSVEIVPFKRLVLSFGWLKKK